MSNSWLTIDEELDPVTLSSDEEYLEDEEGEEYVASADEGNEIQDEMYKEAVNEQNMLLREALECNLRFQKHKDVVIKESEKKSKEINKLRRVLEVEKLSHKTVVNKLKDEIKARKLQHEKVIKDFRSRVNNLKTLLTEVVTKDNAADGLLEIWEHMKRVGHELDQEFGGVRRGIKESLEKLRQRVVVQEPEYLRRNGTGNVKGSTTVTEFQRQVINVVTQGLSASGNESGGQNNANISQPQPLSSSYAYTASMTRTITKPYCYRRRQRIFRSSSVFPFVGGARGLVRGRQLRTVSPKLKVDESNTGKRRTTRKISKPKRFSPDDMAKSPRKPRRNVGAKKKKTRGRYAKRESTSEIHVAQPGSLRCSCGRSYTKKTSLQSHISIKSNGGVYRCQLCPMSFEVLTSFKTHLNQVHHEQYNGGRLSCRICGATTFNSQSELLRHRRIFHGIIHRRKTTSNNEEHF